jgi:peptidoglycan/LPS O-acetylase OafA/YrhL
LRYRAEIDGLRTVAVIPVVLFHAGLSSFSGGYVGVDVFFVISGYLITSIILADKEAGTFTISRFYERRARRILPALFLVMFVTVVFAWIYFLPSDLKEFGQTVAAAAAFAANIYFYLKQNNYFGLQSSENPLLHLWSLAVEEQYYLLFPLFLILTWRFGKRWTFFLIALVLLISLMAAQFGVTRDLPGTFFLLPTRAWELLLGSMLAFLPDRQRSVSNYAVDEALGGCGLFLIVCAIIWFDRQTPFPSLWALLPTIGTALILVFAKEQTITGRFLANRLFVGIGLISFSIYLWHQPLFAFNRFLSYREPSQASFILLTFLSVGLAYLTWRFVENPFRVKGRFSRRTVFALSLVVSGAFIAFGVIGHFNSGYPKRDPLYSRLVSNVGLSLACNGNYSINPTCATSEHPQLAFLGNSYAMHLIEGFRSAYPQKSLVQLTQDSCEPYPGDKLTQVGKLSCAEFYRRALSTILATSSIKTVVLSSPFRDLVQDQNVVALEQAVTTLRESGRRVIIVSPTPSTGADIGKCIVQHRSDFAACDFARADIEPNYPAIIERLRSVAVRQGVTFVDLTDRICDAKNCRAAVGSVIIFRDSGHLSDEGSRYIVRQLKDELGLDSSNNQ